MAESKRAVVVVDDDDEIRHLVARMLRDRYDVYEASTGVEAIDVMDRAQRVDLMICDVMMPGMNGLELVRHLRKAERFKTVPVLFLTAKDQPYDVVAGINAGARSYMTKPFKLSALADKVSHILTRPTRV
jgi:DNA-binding response OmpR family regulator